MVEISDPDENDEGRFITRREGVKASGGRYGVFASTDFERRAIQSMLKDHAAGDAEIQFSRDMGMRRIMKVRRKGKDTAADVVSSQNPDQSGDMQGEQPIAQRRIDAIVGGNDRLPIPGFGSNGNCLLQWIGRDNPIRSLIEEGRRVARILNRLIQEPIAARLHELRHKREQRNVIPRPYG